MAESIDLKSLRVVDLRKELEKRNLSKAGKKEELLTRLEQAITEEEKEKSNTNTVEEKEATTTTTAAAEEEEEEEEEKADVEQEDKDKETNQNIQHTDEHENIQSEKNNKQSPPIEKKSIPQQVEQEEEKEKSESIVDKMDTTKEIQQSSPEKNVQKETSKVEPTTEEIKVEKMEQDQGNKRKRDDADIENDKRVRTDDDSKSSKDTEVKKDDDTSKAVAKTTTNLYENEEQTAICIKDLVRPLISRDVRDLVGKYGEVKRFFLDHVKTHCYAIYETVKEADDALKNIDGIKFPPESGKNVSVIKLYPSQVEKLIKREQELENQGVIRPPWEKFLNNLLNHLDIDEGSNEDNSNDSLNGGSSRRRFGALEQITKQLNQRTTISTIGQARDKKPKSILERLSTQPLPTPPPPTKIPVGKSLDELFLKTKANPPLYYLPVNDTIAADRLASFNKE